jgi:DNA-binding GntR family transcriptional regulator
VLAERIATILLDYEPGSRLPRASALARRYGASVEDIREIFDYLVSRQLVRRTPEGRLYRGSPPEYLIALDGIPGLGAAVDPMGGSLTCLSYGVSRRPATEDAAEALRVTRGEPVGVLRLAWALNGTPAATSTTYLAGHLADPELLTGWLTTGTRRRELPLSPPAERADPASEDSQAPQQVQSAAVQMQLPPVSVARKLRLAPGQMAVLVTVLFGKAGHSPSAFTAAVLRPDMFRIILEAGQPEPCGRSRLARWSLVTADDGP